MTGPSYIRIVSFLDARKFAVNIKHVGTELTPQYVQTKKTQYNFSSRATQMQFSLTTGKKSHLKPIIQRTRLLCFESTGGHSECALFVRHCASTLPPCCVYQGQHGQQKFRYCLHWRNIKQKKSVLPQEPK